MCAVGEPLNIDAWKWYYEVVGDKRRPIVDTCMVAGRCGERYCVW